MIIGQLAMQAIRRAVEEGAAVDVKHDPHTRHNTYDMTTVIAFGLVSDLADVMADMAVHEHAKVRLSAIEPVQADVIRLVYIEAYTKALREHFEGIVDAMRDAEEA